MKIILIAAVQNLGKVGDIVEVRNGFAKNFLIPNKKAICFTVNNAKIFESKKHEFEKASQQGQEAALEIKEKISGKNIIIIENASDDGRLYGSVNAVVVADKINEIIGKKALSRSEIFLKKPIKEIGIYEVTLNLHFDVFFDVKVVVSRSESEAEAILKGDNKDKKEKANDSVVSEETSDGTSVAKPKRAPRKKKEESAE
jgi:large subunit ribosomal protein L9